jgi:hypothetical protein
MRSTSQVNETPEDKWHLTNLALGFLLDSPNTNLMARIFQSMGHEMHTHTLRRSDSATMAQEKTSWIASLMTCFLSEASVHLNWKIRWFYDIITGGLGADYVEIGEHLVLINN